MTRKTRTRLRLGVFALLCLPLSGCSLLFDWRIDHDQKAQYRSTPLVDFLYGDDAVPRENAQAQLELPIRVGLSFLPGENSRTGEIPTADDRAALLAAVRQRFSGLPYITEIVIIPDYYLSARRGKGFDQAEQLSRMFNLDLFALASYDQVVYSGENARALGYLTIVGQFLFKGETHEAHTVVDLAVIEPKGRMLVMRAGGMARFADTSTLADDWRSETQVRRKSFERASASLIDNFGLELTAFEARVRAGTAPVRVARRGGGSLDLLILGALLLALAWRAQVARCSRVAANLIFGQRSMVSSRFTRVGARYTSAPE